MCYKWPRHLGRLTYPGDLQGDALQRNARDSCAVTEYIWHAHGRQELLQLTGPR